MSTRRTVSAFANASTAPHLRHCFGQGHLRTDPTGYATLAPVDATLSVRYAAAPPPSEVHRTYIGPVLAVVVAVSVQSPRSMSSAVTLSTRVIVWPPEHTKSSVASGVQPSAPPDHVPSGPQLPSPGKVQVSCAYAL